MGNVQMEAEMIRYKGEYNNVQSALDAALGGGGGGSMDARVTALEETVGDETSGLVKQVDDLEAAVALLNPNLYSTTETEVGKWGNDTLYRKMYTIAALGNNTTVTIDLDISNVTIKKLYGIATSSNYTLPLPFAGGGTNSVEMGVDETQHKIYIITLKDLSAFSAEVVVEYVKNSAQENNDR